jgi:cation diffusion facilitator family transporter
MARSPKAVDFTLKRADVCAPLTHRSGLLAEPPGDPMGANCYPARLPVDPAARRAQEIRRVLLITLGLNVLVAALKLAYGTMSHTLSLQADGFHSLTDGTNNVLGLVGIWWSARPPDDKHPYGHQRTEVIAASAIGASLILVAWEVARGAIERIGEPAAAPRPDLGSVAVLLLTLLINVGVARYEARRGKALSSTLLESDASHTASDVLVTLGVLLTLAGVHLGLTWMDWVASCVIGVFILVTGARVLWRNVDYLMDTAQVAPERIHAIACAVPGVAGAHKIRTRGVPGSIRVDLHIQIARHLDVVQAHEVTHWVIAAVKHDIEGVHDVVVHTEPAGVDDVYPALPERMLRRVERGAQ